MFDIKSICDNSVVLIINFDTLYLYTNLNNENEIETITYKHSVELTSATYLPNKKLLAFTDLNKKFCLLDRENQIITTKVFQKRAAKILTNQAESVVLLGDKTGDVYSLDLNDLEQSEFKLIMGHLSMLTDMRLSSNEKSLLTSDRDEKIRISKYPNSYNIEGYLLAHKEFVMQFEIVNETTLVSVSGDSKLILWDLNTHKPKQIIEVKKFVQDVKDLNGIDRFDFNTKTNQLFLHLFKSNFLLQFNYDREMNELNFVRECSFGTTIDDFVRLNENMFLFVTLRDDLNSKFMIKKFKEDFIDLDENDSKMKKFVELVNTNVQFEKASELKIEIEKNYQSYFKAIVNNMEDYYQRKQERIQSTTGKRKHTKSESESCEPKISVQ